MPWNLPRSARGTISATIISVHERLPPLPKPWIAVEVVQSVSCATADVNIDDPTSSDNEHVQISRRPAEHGAHSETEHKCEKDPFAPEAGHEATDEGKHGGRCDRISAARPDEVASMKTVDYRR